MYSWTGIIIILYLHHSKVRNMATILAIFLFFVTYAESSKCMWCLAITYIYIYILHVQIGIITEPPRSTSALLYTSANFSCKGTGSVLVWTVAQAMLTETVKQERNVTVFTSNNNGSLSSILNIAALPFNNGVKIGCIIASFDPYTAAAEEVTLTIRGTYICCMIFCTVMIVFGSLRCICSGKCQMVL